MKAKIHKFEQGGHYILLDINSGAVHVIDKNKYFCNYLIQFRRNHIPNLQL